MSGETIFALAVKYGWTSILPYLVWLHRRDKIKLDDTYTKAETNERIELKVDPIRKECNDRTDTLHDKFDTLLDLVKENNTQNSAQRKENNDMLHEIKTEVAVITNEIKNIKEKVD